MTSVADVRAALNISTASLRNGVFTIRKGFFYTGGYTEQMLAAAVKKAFPTAVILESGEVWKSFRGGASVAAQSHWFVKFSISEVA